jgi:putative membrane protein
VLVRQFSIGLIPALLVVTFASALVVAKVIQTIDAKSVSSTRRIFGLLLVATIIWIIPAAIGSLASLSLGPRAAFNEFVFGAFLAWAFELVVINGVFLKSTIESLVLAALHPLLVLAVVTYPHPYTHIYPEVFGTIVLLLAVAFLLKLKSMKTKNGIVSLQLLNAFLKTWVVHEPSELENFFLTYAKKEPVRTGVFLFKTEHNNTALILPGIHPGPFSPVGSYNLSELIYRTVQDKLTAPVVLHGIGGHERNAPTNELASGYALEVKQFVNSANVTEKGFLKGPLHSKVDIANITTLCFGKAVIAMISNAPYLSDDLDPATVTSATEAASELGLELSLVDAHNSVDGEQRAQPAITKEDWKNILNNTSSLKANELSFGFAHSTEIDFKHGLDVSEGGIGVAVFSTAESRSVLVTTDSNNAVSGLRQKIADAIQKMGFEFIELCTSDTHNFAARNLTQRGYFALGEGTNTEDIVAAVEKLARIAEGRTAPCAINASGFESEVPLIGHESLDDFAALTKDTVSFAKSYAKIVIPVSVLLLAVTLFY